MSRADLYLASQQQRARVRAVLERLQGPENARHIKEIAHLAQVEERFCRNAYADFDGEAFVLSKCADGLYVSRDEAEADALSAELLSKLRAIAARLRARKAFWKRQSEIKQIPMFGEVA